MAAKKPKVYRFRCARHDERFTTEAAAIRHAHAMHGCRLGQSEAELAAQGTRDEAKGNGDG